MELVRRVIVSVPARLEHAAVFGSTARAQARPDSDIDVLLIFRHLPPDREPQATLAEIIASEVALDTGVPVETWSVSTADLARGRRTPMLVDALADGIPLWPSGRPIPRLPFTPEDAGFCVRALLCRVREGSVEFAQRITAGDFGSANRRVRDDLVRLCVAALLLRGETRPRRAEAVHRVVETCSVPERWLPVMWWAADSYSSEGDGEGGIAPPPGGTRSAARVVTGLAQWFQRETHQQDQG